MSIHVAVGVILNEQKQILLALRAEHLHQGGLWEFPGGKVEAGESVELALYRELYEELGIRPTESRPLLTLQHDYSDKSVLLDVWWVDQFIGQPTGKEGQTIQWVAPSQFSRYAFPAANTEIVQAIHAALMS